MEINKVKTVNVPIRVWTDEKFVYFNSSETVKYVWGSQTASCDMKRLGLERIEGKYGSLLHYRMMRDCLKKRLAELRLKQERITSAIKVIEAVFKEGK